jgi:hypothetical protein
MTGCDHILKKCRSNEVAFLVIVVSFVIFQLYFVSVLS